MSELMTMRQAADKYGVCYDTIRNYIRQGRLTAYRFGPRLVRLDPAEVETALLAPRDGGA
jgi:excisionase family DNA binding protein